MRTYRKALILTTILQAAPFTWADNTTPPLPSSVAPNAPIHSLPHVNYLNFRLPTENEKSPAPGPIFRGEAADNKGKFEPSNSGHPNGLHWAPGESHPALEYKFSDDKKVHFHVGRHGAGATAVWNF